ncbi:response regulator transcription factor [Sulfobacillus sp. DSM 109850]|uniref:Stage 0 sporulation protein A homolog n=2 Tax=Sulfobacillus harzensis TaxID=2729629 RepID=A0A7Y0L648_9FIRM|nr:response regulator transcription factor [Sulfobacillus harzensis]
MLVDDHALFRSALKSLLADQPDMEVAAEAAGGREAVRLAGTVRPDLVLMDINMADGDGVEATRMIKDRYPEMEVLMLTASDDDELLLDAVRAGASGYLLKHMEPESFLTEIRRRLSGEGTISLDVAAKIVHAVAVKSHAGETSRFEHLSEREQEVLSLVGRGLTNREIADVLNIAENTVKNHLRSILQKLGLENRVQAAAYAIRHGMVDA